MSLSHKRKLRLIFTFVCLSFLFSFLIIRYLSEKTESEVSRDYSNYKSVLESLRTLPYLTWCEIDEEDVDKVGVTKYKPEKSFGGVNLYYTENKPGGYFFDMNGNILHRFIDKRKQAGNWQIIKPYKDNDFLVLIQRKSLFMINWDSNIKWELKGTFHHDVAVAENGDIYVLTNRKAEVKSLSPTEPIRDDFLVILTEDGKIKKYIPFIKMFLQDQKLLELALKQKEKRYDFGKDAWDIFHTNSIEIIDRDIFLDGKRLFKKGDVLFSVRHQNLIIVVDIEEEKIIWSWGQEELDFAHHATLLDNGNILVFDNGFHEGYSRVLEINPGNGEIVWEYRTKPAGDFFSATRGSAQRLGNGNTLIAESDKGRVFEITSDGEVVWEFYNPEIQIRKKQKNRRATIYRMMRIADPERYPGLKQ